MRLSRARSNGPAASCHMLSSVDCITTTSESEFLVHTRGGASGVPVVFARAAGALPQLSIEPSKPGKPSGSVGGAAQVDISHRATDPPLGDTGAPAGGATGIAASVAGGLPG